MLFAKSKRVLAAPKVFREFVRDFVGFLIFIGKVLLQNRRNLYILSFIKFEFSPNSDFTMEKRKKQIILKTWGKYKKANFVWKSIAFKDGLYYNIKVMMK